MCVEDFIHVGADNDIKECEMDGQYEKALKVLYKDLNSTHEVSEDDKDECIDVDAGRVSACAKESFHNVGTQTQEEMPDCNKIFGKETDDQFGTELNE